MPGSRTIRVLVILLLAMTVGAWALMVMQVTPDIATRKLAVVNEADDQTGKVVQQTDVPIQAIKWRNIIIHSSAEGRDVARRCHFQVLPDTSTGSGIAGTELWKAQADGQHAFVAGYDYNADSIGICLMGDFSRNAPSREQYMALVGLVQYLQETCNIKPANVYLYSQLVRVDSPGRSFPAGDFATRLWEGPR